uniref:Uncharacterized protein n=1 Tax=Pseudonaja textilis TaxID=8673 RepID=A0A670ZFG0_PSETE
MGNRQTIHSWGPSGTSGYWPQRRVWGGPPPINTSFDGNPDRLALFLSQTVNHLELYSNCYPSQWSIIVAITTSSVLHLEGPKDNQ